MIDLYLPEKLQRRIVEKYERCEELDARATGYGSPSEFKERVRTSSPQDGGFEMLILRKVVIEKEIAALQDKQRDALKAILDVAGTMQDENAELKQQLEEKDLELERLRQLVSETAEQLEQAKERNSAANTVEKTLGVFAKFGVLCRWDEMDADVDIGVQKYGSSPDHCWRMYPSKPWGILGEDVRERDIDENERFELFYVPKIYPDIYTVYARVYEGSRGLSANLSTVLIFHPGKDDETRYEVPSVAVNKRKNTWFVTFRLTEYGFEILPLREPIWGDGKVIK